MHIVNDAHTKLILFGEHSAIYGYPAMGVRLPWKVTATLAPSSQIHSDPLSKKMLQLFPQLAKKPVSFSSKGDVPMGIGLGSSAALCVALTRCLLTYLEMPTDSLTTWKYAHELEKNFHLTPSGIDTGLSIFGNSFFLKKEAELPECKQLNSKLHLVMGALPRQSDTKTLIANLKKQKESSSEIELLIQKLGSIATHAIESSDPLGKLATEAHQCLNSLGLSTTQLNKLINQGLKLGATGGKLSGAGGGGAYFFLVESFSQAESLAFELNLYAQKEGIEQQLTPRAFSS